MRLICCLSAFFKGCDYVYGREELQGEWRDGSMTSSVVRARGWDSIGRGSVQFEACKPNHATRPRSAEEESRR